MNENMMEALQIQTDTEQAGDRERAQVKREEWDEDMTIMERVDAINQLKEELMENLERLHAPIFREDDEGPTPEEMEERREAYRDAAREAAVEAEYERNHKHYWDAMHGN